jgi:hypothetical protein
MLDRDLKRQTPAQAAAKMLAEKNDLNKRTRLSWNKDKFPLRGEGKYVGGEDDEKGLHKGGVCLSLPYVNVEKKYYIQNCAIFKTNGDEVTLEQVFKAENGGAVYLRVVEAFDNYKKGALEHDEALCRHCLRYRSESTTAMLQHMVDEHPDVVAAMAGVNLESKPHPKPKAEDTVAPYCESCDRTFVNVGGLRLHRLKKHDKAV